MTGPLSEHHALITGGGSGIGAAIAVALVDAGARVTITGRNETPMANLATDHPSMNWVVANVTDAAAVASAFDTAAVASGPVTIAVANAGLGESEPFTRMSDDHWHRIIDINLNGVFNTFRHAVTGMTGGRGRLVTIASTAGLKGYGYVSAYCAAKHGAVGLTRALAIELKGKGITANAICPGYTETPMLERSIDNIMAKTGLARADVVAQLLQDTSSERFVQPEEVAEIVLDLCTGDRTGQVISLPGEAA